MWKEDDSAPLLGPRPAPQDLAHAAPPEASPSAFLRGPYRFVLHYVAARPWQFAALFAAVAGGAGCGVAVQYVMKLLVDAMAGPREASAAVWFALTLFVAFIAGESIFGRLTGWLACRTTLAVGVDMRLDLFGYLNGQPIRYFADNLAGSLGQRVTATAGNFGALTNTMVWRILPPCIDFIGALIIFLSVDWRMMLALGIFVTAITGGLIWFGERGRPLHRNYAAHAGIVAGELVDVITNMWAVKAFSARFREAGRLSEGFHREALAQRRSWLYLEKARALHDIALCMMAGGMLSWAVYLWSAGRITPGDVVVVSTLTFRILTSSRDLALSLVDTAQQLGYIEDTLRVIAQPQSVVDAPDAEPVVAKGGAVDYRNVSFSYGGDARTTLEGLNLHIPAGQKVGIVGPSGAGKSTLIHLLQRLYDVQAGEVLIDGQPITQVKQDSLRATLAVVPQEITLFHRTLMENIRFARPDASDEEVFAAARAACCDGFIRATPHGYDTLVGERGMKLSGGQRQRIGIARAFLKDAPIIILDEATSALDTDSEMEIQRSLVRLMRGRTVIAVAHRLSTLAAFDRIIVIDRGQVVEDGAPAALRNGGGLFETMWRLQAEGLSSEEAVEHAA
jgi:ATP-binding cassette subfamily B protein